MMLSLSPSMQAKLDQRATTFCHCWRVARNDATAMGFTDHDRDLTFNGVTFRANTGLSASQLESSVGFAPGTGEATGALSDESLTEADLLNGLYDGASVETWLVDWTNVTDRALLDIATIGEIRRGEMAFAAELRSSAHLFDQQQGRAFQRSCSADLGDARCAFDVMAPGFHATSVIAAFVGGAIDMDLSELFDCGFFAGGVLTFTSGANENAHFTIKSHWQENFRATVTLWTPPGGAILAGDVVVLTAGCDKSPTACRLKFDNIVNFRGFPHMPGNDRIIAYPSSLAPAMDGGSLFYFTRADIVAAARRWRGTPYVHQASLIHVGCDCLGLVRGVWRDIIGDEPEAAPAYTPDWAEALSAETLLDAAHRHFRVVALSDFREGDVLLFRFREHLPAKHLGIAISTTHMIHAHAGACVAQVAIGPHWRKKLVAAFAFPNVVD